jgi:hypothetical protein
MKCGVDGGGQTIFVACCVQKNPLYNSIQLRILYNCQGTRTVLMTRSVTSARAMLLRITPYFRDTMVPVEVRVLKKNYFITALQFYSAYVLIKV